jgi:hypothetical protein
MSSLTISVLLLALLVPRLVTADSDIPRCDERLIRGSYAFTIEGEKLGGPGPVGKQVGVAMTTFDGHGHLTDTATVTINGVLFADFASGRATGDYTVNPDCTGTFTHVFTDGRPTVTVNFVIAANGDEIYSVVIPPPPSTVGEVGIVATRSIGKRLFTSSR